MRAEGLTGDTRTWLRRRAGVGCACGTIGMFNSSNICIVRLLVRSRGGLCSGGGVSGGSSSDHGRVRLLDADDTEEFRELLVGEVHRPHAVAIPVIRETIISACLLSNRTTNIWKISVIWDETEAMGTKE
eukprot:COSAG05_NODE_1064_length_5991_cov_12.180414_11_plen_130_part_00